MRKQRDGFLSYDRQGPDWRIEHESKTAERIAGRD